MKQTKTWDETWGKIDKDDAYGWCKVTPKEIDEMVANGANVNYTHVETIEPVGDLGELRAFSEYPLELAALSKNIEACEALRKHGAFPRKIFQVAENEGIEYISLLEEIIQEDSKSEVISYLLKQVKMPVTPKDLILSVRENPAHVKLLLDHFDLKAHPNFAKMLLKENIWSEQDKEKKESVQFLILNAMQKESTKNNQNSKATNLKLAEINLGR